MQPNDLLFWGLTALVVFFGVRMFLAARNRISPADARAKVEKGALLLDVRTPGEFAMGAIPGAKNIPVQSLGGRLDELAKDKPIVVYCASGMRSASALSLLKSKGYDAYDLGPASRW
jgi:rhodanese-related sulfurtransferase